MSIAAVGAAVGACVGAAFFRLVRFTIGGHSDPAALLQVFET
jgi:hypothetical protein